MGNRWWTENDGRYELHFRRDGKDVTVLSFAVLGLPYVVYDSAELNAIEEYAEYQSVEQAKAEFELMYEHHIIHKMEHYFAMLMQWKE